MTTLTDDLVPDQLWALVAALLPAPPRPPYGGRRPAPDHLRPGLLGRDRLHGPHLHPLAAAARPGAWLRLTRDLLAPPHRMGQRRRLDQLHLVVLDRLGEQGRLEWERAAVDT
jgi:hypothetical protein